MKTIDYYATTGDRVRFPVCEHESSSGETVDGIPSWVCDECGHHRPKTTKQIALTSFIQEKEN